MATAAVEIPDWRHSRGRIAALSRSRSADDPELLAARRDLRAARLADHVREAVAGWPPLSDKQRSEIAALLRPTGGGSG
jgi:hypothetical protein